MLRVLFNRSKRDDQHCEQSDFFSSYFFSFFLANLQSPKKDFQKLQSSNTIYPQIPKRTRRMCGDGIRTHGSLRNRVLRIDVESRTRRGPLSCLPLFCIHFQRKSLIKKEIRRAVPCNIPFPNPFRFEAIFLRLLSKMNNLLLTVSPLI